MGHWPPAIVPLAVGHGVDLWVEGFLRRYCGGQSGGGELRSGCEIWVRPEIRRRIASPVGRETIYDMISEMIYEMIYE
jgi:hypothetical protein